MTIKGKRLHQAGLQSHHEEGSRRKQIIQHQLELEDVREHVVQAPSRHEDSLFCKTSFAQRNGVQCTITQREQLGHFSCHNIDTVDTSRYQGLLEFVSMSKTLHKSSPCECTRQKITWQVISRISTRESDPLNLLYAWGGDFVTHFDSKWNLTWSNVALSLRDHFPIWERSLNQLVSYENVCSKMNRIIILSMW